MKLPGLGCMDEVELESAALLRLQQLLHCSRAGEGHAVRNFGRLHG